MTFYLFICLLAPLIAASTVEFTLVIQLTWKTVRGIEKAVVSVNNSNTIGPMLRVREGDTVRINVYNKLFTEGTSIHWHGFHQTNTPYMDGVAFVTQCPIPPNENATYEFVADRAGIHWYHGHSMGQRDDAFFGAFIVDSNASLQSGANPRRVLRGGVGAGYEYDEERVLLLSDFYFSYEPYNQLSLASQPFRWIGSPNVLLVNGLEKYQLELEPGKTYLIHFISAAALSWYNISMPGHNLTVVEVEGSLIDPFVTPDLHINAGERYSVLLKADNPGCYHMGISMLDRLGPSNYINVTYTTVNCLNDSWISGSSDSTFDEMDMQSIMNETLPNATRNITLRTVQATDEHGAIWWEINNVTWVPPTEPLLFPLSFLGKVPKEFLRNLFFVRQGEVVDLVFYNDDNWAGLQEQHPMHLHGHSFWVLGTGNTTTSTPHVQNARHPVKRDTFTLRRQHWAIIRVLANNPGVWLLHCHVSWHLDMGMALAMAYETVPLPPTNFEQCGSDYDAFVQYNPVTLLVMLSVVVVMFLSTGIFVYWYSYISAMRRNDEILEMRGIKEKTEHSKLLPTLAKENVVVTSDQEMLF